MLVTTAGSARAVWKIAANGQVQIVFVDDRESAAPARRWPDTPMPSCRTGHVAFDPRNYPALETARTWLPECSALWDAVAQDLAAARSVAGSAARAHGEFFRLPAIATQ
ncbi:hypothetical protein ACIGO9_30255 [Nocardia asteroides]|uniref:hypothetical protein n=1 Tax=Nocardia asteroides TaxID=1824 RepID=UPI0037C595A4